MKYIITNGKINIYVNKKPPSLQSTKDDRLLGTSVFKTTTGALPLDLTEELLSLRHHQQSKLPSKVWLRGG